MIMNDFDDERTMEEEEALDGENEEDEVSLLIDSELWFFRGELRVKTR